MSAASDNNGLWEDNDNMGFELSQKDVDMLTQELPAEVRSMVAQKVSDRYRDGKLEVKERRVAEQIFRLLAHDTEMRVRRILSDQLKNDPHLPHDLALKLAKDVADVSVPMLESSSVLTERDLIDIVESSSEMVCRLAIAQREDVTTDVSQALVNAHEETVVNALVANQKAQISTAAIAQVVEEYSARDSVMAGLVNRGGLPLSVAERMVSLVSDALKKDLVKRYKVSPYVLEDAVESTREWATLGLMDPRASLNIAELVENLSVQKKLTPSLIIRSLCMGNLKFFEAAMAKRANIPAENARRLIMDKGHLGFRAMYKAAGMPPGVVDAVKTVVNLAYEETDNATRWPDDYPNRMIERILAGGYDQTVDNMPYLMAIIGRNIRIGGGLLSVDYTTEALPAA